MTDNQQQEREAFAKLDDYLKRTKHQGDIAGVGNAFIGGWQAARSLPTPSASLDGEAVDIIYKLNDYVEVVNSENAPFDAEHMLDYFLCMTRKAKAAIAAMPAPKGVDGAHSKSCNLSYGATFHRGCNCQGQPTPPLSALPPEDEDAVDYRSMALSARSKAIMALQSRFWAGKEREALQEIVQDANRALSASAVPENLTKGE